MVLKGAAIGLLLALGSPAALGADVVIDVPAAGSVVRSPVKLRKGMEMVLSGIVMDQYGCEYDSFYSLNTPCQRQGNLFGQYQLIRAGPEAESGSPKRTVMYYLQFPYPDYQPSHEYHMTIAIPKGALALGKAKFCVTNHMNVACGSGEAFDGTVFKKGDFKLTIVNADAPEEEPVASLGSFSGDVSIRHKGGSFTDAGSGDSLQEGDDISTGPDGTATLTLADGKTITVAPNSQVNIASLIREQNDVRVRVNLALGRAEAKIARSQTSIPSFSIRTPNATASVRGTKFTVFYDPGSKATIVATQQHAVSVDPVKRGLPTRMVTAGKEVEITAKKITRPARKADARGGIDRARAFDLVAKLLTAAATPCGLAKGAAPFTVAARPGGWLVTVKLSAPTAGPATWSVAGAKAAPTNALAQRITAGCG